MVYLYIIENSKGKHYTGITSLNPNERLARHNSGDVISTKFGKPWKIIYTQQFTNFAEARVFEKKIKSWKGGNAFRKFISSAAGSANGRPMDSGSINLGSNPSPVALEGNLAG